jgi:hypothetical protein
VNDSEMPITIALTAATRINIVSAELEQQITSTNFRKVGLTQQPNNDLWFWHDEFDLQPAID